MLTHFPSTLCLCKLDIRLPFGVILISFSYGFDHQIMYPVGVLVDTEGIKQSVTVHFTL